MKVNNYRNVGVIVMILGLLPFCQPKSKPILNHWLQGEWTAVSYQGTMHESWSHPSKDIWESAGSIQGAEGQITYQLKINKVDADLILTVTEGNKVSTLPVKTVDTDHFDFRNDEGEFVTRMKFERVDENSFRRVVNALDDSGQQEMQILEFKKK